MSRLQVSYSPRQQGGFVVVTILVFMLIVGLLITLVTSTAIGNYQSAVAENARVNAQFAADSGLDYAVYEINSDETWPGTGYTWDGSSWVGVLGEQDLYNTTNVRTTYEIEVINEIDGTKAVRSTGRSYVPSSNSEPSATRIFEIELENLVASNTAIVTGVGGLKMQNSSKIIDGTVYINGQLEMGGTSQIGTSDYPLSVFVVNKVCPIPADATYPQLCTAAENTDPISINSPNSYIYGKVYANHQVDDDNMIDVDDPATSAIEQSSGLAEQPLPTHDRDAMIAAMPYADPLDPGEGTAASAASCTINNGTRIWGGVNGEGEKIIGDVTVSRRCNVDIRGPVWITGSLEMRNQGSITVNDSLGSTMPVIMIDGENGLETNQSSEFVQNGTGANVQVITDWSDAACSPGCSDVTGIDLANSQDVPTIDIVNAAGANEAVFYAKWSKVIIRNSVDVGALIGQVVELEQSATIAFGSGFPGFTPRSVWIKQGYLRIFQ